MNKETSQLAGKAYEDSDYTLAIATLTQMYNNCAETHLGGGVIYEPFCLPVSAIAQAHDPTVIGRVTLRKGPRRFCPHPSDHCRALMLTCQNSPLWQRWERCNNVLSPFWLPWLHQLNSMVITWHALSCKLAGYNYTSNLTLEQCLSTSWWMQTEISTRSVQPATRSTVATWNITGVQYS